MKRMMVACESCGSLYYVTFDDRVCPVCGHNPEDRPHDDEDEPLNQ